MKKVILEKREEEVYLSDLNEDSIIGLQTKLFGIKFIILRTNQGFEWIGESNLSSKDRYKYSSIEDACKIYGNVYVFETTKELLKWMSE